MMLTAMDRLSPTRQVVTFRLDQQSYALPVETVIQVVEMVAMTRLPHIDGSVVGAINLHGEIIPIVDLRGHLQLPEAAHQRHTPILLAQAGQHSVGLIVDEVTEVVSITPDQIRQPVDILPAGVSARPLLQGVVRQAAPAPLLLLDLQYLFQPSQVQALIEAIASLAHVHPYGTAGPVLHEGSG
ncbi:MAG TPA: chemotaxis protein CheW [Anaerolineae bacterium]